MSTYPRYVQAGTVKWEKPDLDAVVDHVLAGESDTGFYAYPYTYLIRNIGGVYDAVDNTGTRVYGGAGDEGGVEGTDANAVIAATITAISALTHKRLYLKGNITLTDKITLIPELTLVFDTLTIANTDKKALYYYGAGEATHIQIIGRKIVVPEHYATSVIQLVETRFSTVYVDSIAPTTGYGNDGSRGVDLQSWEATDGSYYNRVCLRLITGIEYPIYLLAGTGGNVNENYFYDTQISSAQIGVYMYNQAAGQAVGGNRFDKVWVYADHDYFGGTTYGFYGSNAGGAGSINNAFIECEVSDVTAGCIGLYLSANFGARWLGGALDATMTVQVSNAGSLKIRDCDSFVTENWGTDSILNGNTFSEAHGLAGTPTHIDVTSTAGMSAADSWILTGKDDTTFEIATGYTGAQSISWHAIYKP